MYKSRTDAFIFFIRTVMSESLAQVTWNQHQRWVINILCKVYSVPPGPKLFHFSKCFSRNILFLQFLVECCPGARDQTWNPSRRTSPNFFVWQAPEFRWERGWQSDRCWATAARSSWKCDKWHNYIFDLLILEQKYLFKFQKLWSDLLSHSDLSKSGKNTQDGKSCTRAKITCQNEDENCWVG